MLGHCAQFACVAIVGMMCSGLLGSSEKSVVPKVDDTLFDSLIPLAKT